MGLHVPGGILRDVPGSLGWDVCDRPNPPERHLGSRAVGGPTVIRFRRGTSASPGRLDGGDVDLLHCHHRLEGTLCLSATGRKRID
jgi:hypothetical protein